MGDIKRNTILTVVFDHLAAVCYTVALTKYK